MNRRRILQSALGLAGVGVMRELLKTGRVVRKTLRIPALPCSIPICLQDARSAANFAEIIRVAVKRLSDDLPKKEKFQLVWRNVYDEKLNPHQNIGHFIAVPGDPNQKDRIMWDDRGMLRDLTKKDKPA